MKKGFVSLTILAYFGLFILVVAVFGHFWKRAETVPPQPIAFSHEIHVGKLNLKCTVCHTMVDKSIHATVPAVATCMSCHKGVARDKPEVQKLIRYWENQEPIPWIKVHDLPDHVYFSHKRHIKAGLDCANCHGEVKVMPEIRQVRSLKMGWCVDCHTAKGAPKDCYTCHK